MTNNITNIRCLECNHQLPLDLMATSCPKCHSAWLDAQYDYESVAKRWPAELHNREHSLWRYQELLPIHPTFPEIPMGEGFTPLIRLYQFETLYNHPFLYMKDERHQPTNSFKDRQAALSVMAMKQHGITECTLASTGNAAVAYAAYCARAGIKLWLFLTSLVPSEKMRECAIYGAEVVKVSGTYDETKKVAAEFAQQKGIHLDRGAKAIPGKESMKTLAYEIAEQLGLSLDPTQPNHWVAPDWYIQGVSGGIGPLGVLKGFTELLQMGLVDKIPKLGIVQASGCAPMVNAFQNNQEKATPVTPKTLITVLATGDPGFSYELLRKAILEHGGAMVAVEDSEAFQAIRYLASKAGISVEPATAVAFAGLEKMLRDGTIAPDEKVVVNCSGHTFPVEKHVLGSQYDHYILDFEPSQQVQMRAIEDGLSAVLQTLDEQVTTIVVVDDNANDRRLMRRLIQTHKNYRVYEARNGVEALQVIKDRKPNLVISDLMMPEMDGFSLIEKLKADTQTANIPIVIISAKSLTQYDRLRLTRYSSSIWSKDGSHVRGLMDSVVEILGHSPIEKTEAVKAQSTSQTVTKEAVGEPDSVGHTIVMIDDNPNDIRLVQKMLAKESDYLVLGAETGRDGLKTVYNYHPDLIILDMMLPDMNGLSVIQRLQDDPQLREIPIVVYTAGDTLSTEYEELRKQIDTIITKAETNSIEFLNIIKQKFADSDW